ncbi:MAG: hypothetical protein NTX27_19360, partial [Verrucomicrobia bacterium]|nr:hypothetical protein [Verrucomicrobiota bacterium]
AGRLRRETTLTIGKIAQRLHLGSSKSANARIHEWMRAQAKESVNENLNQPGEKTNAKYTMLWSDRFTVGERISIRGSPAITDPRGEIRRWRRSMQIPADPLFPIYGNLRIKSCLGAFLA